jgi:hypothetical protein
MSDWGRCNGLWNERVPYSNGYNRLFSKKKPRAERLVLLRLHANGLIPALLAQNPGLRMEVRACRKTYGLENFHRNAAYAACKMIWVKQ